MLKASAMLSGVGREAFYEVEAPMPAYAIKGPDTEFSLCVGAWQKLLDVSIQVAGCMGSFDFANASLREPFTSLRMTWSKKP